MSEEPKVTTIQIEHGLTDTSIGPDSTGEYLILVLPIREWVADDMNGRALLHGKMRELEAWAMGYFVEQLKKKALGGITRVGPRVPNLKVN